MLVRSDYVGHLSAVGREAVTEYGITTIIDLRSPAEVLKAPNPFAAGIGPAYVHHPLVDDANMRQLGEATDMFERYLMILENRQAAFCSAFTAVAEAEGGVVFHCFAGKDRTGLVAALLLAASDVTEDAIVADFAETDVQLAQQYKKWIADAPADKREAVRQELRCPPDWILGVLDYLDEQWGGVESYLEASGMTPTNIDKVSQKLV